MASLRMLAPALACAALLALPGSAAAAPSAARVLKKSVVQGVLAGCKTGTPARTAVFRGSMPAGRDAGGRMEMRFDLFARLGRDGAWLPVDVDGFSEWDVSDAGVSGFIIKKRVGGLLGGYSYRAVVRFRWRNAAGKVVRTARKVTASCRQPDTAPDLVVGEPSIVAGPSADIVVYRAVVKNTGPGSANPFDVVLAVNGVAQPAQRLGPLAPRQTVQVSFQAPRCQAGTIVRFTVDAKAEIAELSETNNALERRCAPSRAAPAAR